MARPTTTRLISEGELTADGKIPVEVSFPSLGVQPSMLNFPLMVDLGAPIAASTNRIVTSVNLTNTTLTIAAQPDCPRNVTVNVTDTTPSITAGLVTVTGLNPAGGTVVEVFNLATALVQVGTKIFASVTSVVTSGIATLGGAGDETIIVGVGSVIGLPTPIVTAGAVKHVYLAGTRQASPTVVTGSETSGVNASAGTYDGSKALRVLYNPGQ